MIYKAVLVLTLFGVILETRGACINCGLGSGKDVCRGKCAEMIVRPVKLPKLDPGQLCQPKTICQQIAGIPLLKPIGDLCSANRAIVKPALVPKPPCALCQSALGAASSGCAYQQGCSYEQGSSYVQGASSYQQGPSDPSIVIDIQSGGGNSASLSASGSCASSGYVMVDGYNVPAGQVVAPGHMPADPVSLELAYNMQNKLNRIYEDKLFFGFRTMPKDVEIPKVVKPVFPEEILHGLNGEVVELKVVNAPGQDPTIDEEAIEAMIQAEEDEEEAAAQVKKLTYSEIGFGPAKPSEVQYIKVEGQADASALAAAQAAACGSVPCNDGYVPGSVVVEPVKKQQICFETLSDPNYPEDPDDDDDDDDAFDDDEYTHSGLLRAPFYHRSSCRSCSSCCAKSRHNLVLGSVRCS